MNFFTSLVALFAFAQSVTCQQQYCALPASSEQDRSFNVPDGLDSNGNVRSGSSATLECSSGKIVLGGAATSFCLNGQWQADFGNCQDFVPPGQAPQNSDLNNCINNVAIDNGVIVPTGNPNEYVISCNSGFDVVGPAFVYCFTSGPATVTGKCVPVPPPTEPPTTTTTTPTTTTKSTTTTTTTTTAKPSPTRRRPLCYSSSVQNGVIAASGYETYDGRDRYGHAPGSTISLTCNEGYLAVGQTFAICGWDGFWSTSVGLCLRSQTQTMPPVKSTPQALAPSRPITIRSPPTPKPAANFAPTSKVPPPIRPVQSTAAPMNCYVPQITYGSITLTPSSQRVRSSLHKIAPSTQIKITCDSGYQIAYGSDSAVCQQDGSFSAQLGDCLPLPTTTRATQPPTAPPTTPGLARNLRTVVIFIDDAKKQN